MYVRILDFVARPHLRVDEITAVYHEVVDAVGEQDGFLGSTLFMSEDTHRGMAMTFWRDAECATNAAPAYLAAITARIHDLVEHPPSIAGYHVMDEDVFAWQSRPAG
jgi:heme-degrading monooxygenase HmoA